MSIEKKLEELGINLPEASAPIANYVQAVKTGHMVFTSGQLPMVNNKIKYIGKFGENLTIADGVKAAEISTLNALSAIKKEIGDLDKIKRIVKVTGYLNCAEGFSENSKITEGASQLLIKIFGERGFHTRSSIGVSNMPNKAALAIELIVEVFD
ncbi:MAG: RidA family protein [Candidatus Asgardarchaeia archaeon]